MLARDVLSVNPCSQPADIMRPMSPDSLETFANPKPPREDEIVPVTHRVPVEDTLDLHAFAPRDVASVVAEFVVEAHARGFAEVRLIHGRGVGVQRRTVHETLARHPIVEDFWDAPRSHLGATIASLTKSRP